jgi:GTP-binding protein Era
MTENTKCGYVAIIGCPNVGKSTLLNCLVGKKISITSPKPQTTRHQILGIKTTALTQAVFIDTPGLHQAEKRAMNRYMNRLAHAVIEDADMIVFIVTAGRFQNDDALVLEKLKQTQSPVILVINKIDLMKDKRLLLPFIDKLQALFHFRAIIPLSAKNKDNVNILDKTINDLLPNNPFFFPENQITDKNERFQITEIIREKLIKETEQELPYSTTVILESLTEETQCVRIHAIIWVEREGQKPIVIGKNGERLKKISTHARKEIEKLLAKKIFLRVWVKVKDDWTNDERALGSLGYE